MQEVWEVEETRAEEHAKKMKATIQAGRVPDTKPFRTFPEIEEWKKAIQTRHQGKAQALHCSRIAWPKPIGQD